MTRFIPVSLLLLLCLTGVAHGQCPTNIDFELGTLTNWSCFTGINVASTPTVWTSGPPVAGRHSIVTGSGVDPYGGFPVVAPGGGLYSMMLGNNLTGSQTEKVTYSFTVPASSGTFSLYFRYAVVFQNPPNHTPAEQPFFKVVAYDAVTGQAIPCDSNMFISSGTLPGFIETSRGSDIWYKDWSAGTLKLDGLAGRTVFIEFTSADCTQSGHFGYGYVDMNCGNYGIISANCNGSPTTPLTGPPGFQSYTWYDAGYTTVLGNSRTIFVNTPTSGSPTFHVVLEPYPGYGCTDTLSTQIVFSTLSVDATPDSTNLCQLSGIQFNTNQTGSAPPFTYNWTPTAGLSCVSCAAPYATPANTTTYTVQVTDNNGCTIADSVKVIAGMRLALSQQNVTCATARDGSATVAVTNGTAPFTYSWNTTPVQTTATATNLPTGNFTVTVTDATGCTKTGIVAIGVANPNITETHSNVSCYGGNNGTIAITSVFGTAPNTYSWNTNPVQTTSAIYNLTAGIYTVTIGEASGCTTTRTVVITQPPALTLTGSATNALCAGQNTGALYMTAGGGAQPYTYSWSTTPPQVVPVVTNVAPGTYTGTVVDNNGCTASITRTVSSVSDIHITSSVVSRSCPGERNSAIVTVASGGIGTMHYRWDVTPVRTTQRLDNIGAGTYVVSVTDSLGCTVNDTVIVTDYAAPVITTGPDQEICAGEQVQLVVNGASTYAWSPQASLSCSSCSNPFAGPQATTTYEVIGTDANGCRDTATVKVTVIPRVPVSVNGTVRICSGDKVTLGASGGVDYAWSPADSLEGPFLATPVASPKVTTTYQVIITENRCFRDTLAQTVEVMPLPTVDAGHGFSGIPGAQVQLHATSSPVSAIRWTPAAGLSCADCFSPVATLDKNIIYLVEVTDSNGCKAVDTLRILVSCDASVFYMANTFTPNNDGNNDYFYPQAFGVNTVQRFMVYNRWGEIMFAATNIPVNTPEKGWNGLYKGKELPPDVFVYVVEALCADGTPVVVKGDIALVR